MKKIALLVIMLFSFIPQVFAEDVPSVEIYPNRGSIYTDIFLKIRGGMGDGKCYVTLDNQKIILSNIAQQLFGNPSGFDIIFRVPNEYPYSELGVHKLKIEIYYMVVVEIPRVHGEARYFETVLSYEIVDYYPPKDLFLEWWNSLSQAAREQLRGQIGPQGPRGIQGERGPTGPQGLQGLVPYRELYLLIGISALSMILSIYAISRTKRRYR